jgi:hypothetical protein
LGTLLVPPVGDESTLLDERPMESSAMALNLGSLDRAETISESDCVESSSGEASADRVEAGTSFSLLKNARSFLIEGLRRSSDLPPSSPFLLFFFFLPSDFLTF